jgi:hypothetical protein
LLFPIWKIEQKTKLKNELTTGEVKFSACVKCRKAKEIIGNELFPCRILFAYQIFFKVEPKSKNQINNNRRGHCNKGEVDKIQSDYARSNSQFLTQKRTYSENSCFNKIFETVHRANINL